MSYKASVIISIYDNIRFLNVVLDSLKRQTEKNFEIVISEDAQHEEVKSFIENYDFENDYQHITQEDAGWRKNRALNNAIRTAKSDWLIFIDGDCVLHPRFVEMHVKYAGDKVILAGKRVILNPRLSEMLIEGIDSLKYVQKKLSQMCILGKEDGVGFIEEGLFCNPNGVFGFIPRIRSIRDLKGSNMSFSKAAVYAINGFDEDYTLPAIGEDSDLTWRFEAVGYKLKSMRNLAIQYHLYHKENWKDATDNIRLMEGKKEENLYFCKNGLVPATDL